MRALDGQRAAGMVRHPRSRRLSFDFSAGIALEFVAVWLRVGVAIDQVHYFDERIKQRLSELLDFLPPGAIRQQ